MSRNHLDSSALGECIEAKRAGRTLDDSADLLNVDAENLGRLLHLPTAKPVQVEADASEFDLWSVDRLDVPWRQTMFRVAEGNLNSSESVTQAEADASHGGRSFEAHRFFCDDDGLFHHDGRTYAFTNQWGPRCIKAMDELIAAFPNERMSYKASE